MHSFTAVALSVLLSPIRIVFLPSVKIYWLYLASTIIITLAFVFWQKLRNQEFSATTYLRKVLSRKIWLHESAILDYKYYVINTILFALVFNYFVLTVSGVSIFVEKNLTAFLGQTGDPMAPNSLIIIAYSIAFWLMNDFGRFLAHLLLHKTVLWEFHKLHHSAKVLNPLTVYRVHPVEAILTNSLGALFSGIATGITVFLFPNGINMISFLGVNAGIFIFNLYANLRHSHIAIHFPKWLSHIFLSPAQHQIHHSNDVHLQNKNLGVSLAIWDLVLGSIYIPEKSDNENLVFGLKEETMDDFQNVSAIYLLPFKKIFEKFRSKS